MVFLFTRKVFESVLTLCVLVSFAFAPALPAQAAPLFSEDFEGDGPYSVDPGLSVGTIGRAADCRGMSSSGSAASGKAVCGRRTDASVTIDLPRLAASSTETGFELTVAIAGYSRSFETSDYLEISLNGQVIDRFAGTDSADRQRLVSPVHGTLESRGAFADFRYTLPAGALTRPSRLAFRIRTSATGERIGVDAIRISGPQARGDVTAPKLVLPGEQVAEATGPDGAAVGFEVTVSDDTDGTVEATCTPASGSTFPIGATTVRCSASDAAGNDASGEFTVTVKDSTAPRFGPAPEGLAFEATGPAGASAEFSISATDAVDASPSVECSPASGSVFPVGSSTVGCIATDASGNSSSLSFPVTVLDTTAPQLTLPSELRAEAISAGGTSVRFEATATDLTDAAPTVSCIPASGSQFALGDTTVTCEATDADGNRASGSFLVSVFDSGAPNVEVPENLTAEATSASGAVVSFEVTATDGADSAPQLTCAPASGSTFPIGESTVQCTATDSSGNTGSASFLVSVVDTQAPSLSLPGDIRVEAASESGARVSFKASADDTAGSASVDCAPASGSLFAVGTTTVNCEARDEAGNTASGSFAVAVAAPPPPEVVAGGTSAVLTWTVPTTREDGTPLEASELVGYQIEVAPTAGGPKEVVEIGNGATTTYTVAGLKPGEYEITVRARDANGLLSPPSKTILYTARDLEAPQLAMPDPVTVEATGASGARVDFQVSATDGNDGQVAVNCSPQSGSVFALGQTTVNCEASDAAGNAGTGSFTVAVVDTTRPDLKLPGTLSAEASSARGTNVDFIASATDTVDGTAAVSCLPASGSTFPVGSTTVSCTARDSSGNEASGSFLVAVTAPPAAEPEPPTAGTGDDTPASAGSALLSWSVPSTREDGSPLTAAELAGYQVTIASSSGTTEVDIDDPLQISYTVSGLAPDTYEFVIRARDVNGLLSNASTPVSKTIGDATSGTGTIAGTGPTGGDGTSGSVDVAQTDPSGSGTVDSGATSGGDGGTVADGSLPVGGTGSGGTAVLTWSIPTTRANGDPLSPSELAGYEIYVTGENTGVSEVLRVANPMATTYTVDNLAPDTYYFAITAYDANGLASELSAIVTKVIP